MPTENSKVWVVTSIYKEKSDFVSVVKNKKTLLHLYPNLICTVTFCQDIDKQGNGIIARLHPLL